MAFNKKAPIHWFGGKSNLKSHILPYLDCGSVYVEPYGGAGAILFAKDPHPCEVYNDINSDLCNLMRTIQDPERAQRLYDRLIFTLYSKEEFCLAIDILNDKNSSKDDRAWALFVAQNQGFGGMAKDYGDWGRVFVSAGGMARNCSIWQSKIKGFGFYHQRLMSVQIDNRDALEIIEYWDSVDTLFYLDPPYMHETRQKKRYDYELTDTDHEKLINILSNIKGYAVLSGYSNTLYNQLGWQRIDIEMFCHSAGRVRGSNLQGRGTGLPRTECLWLSPRVVTNNKQITLF